MLNHLQSLVAAALVSFVVGAVMGLGDKVSETTEPDATEEAIRVVVELPAMAIELGTEIVDACVKLFGLAVSTVLCHMGIVISISLFKAKALIALLGVPFAFGRDFTTLTKVAYLEMIAEKARPVTA